MSEDKKKDRIVLVTGASGYVGGRLVSALEERGERVRCLTRNPGYLAGRFSPDTRIIADDVLDTDSLEAALAGVDTAYYMVHSMGSGDNFEEQDRIGARNFAPKTSRSPASPMSLWKFFALRSLNNSI